MSIRGAITLECDRPKCHGEDVLDAKDFDLVVKRRGDIWLEAEACGWREGDDGELWCPQCVEEALRRDDDGHERAAARARNNDFAETGGKDWT